MNNGYAICLNKWMDDDLILKKDLLVLLLRISSLTANDGSCFASNKYFSEKLKQSEVTISRKIKLLIDSGYIKVDYKKQGALITYRTIRLTHVTKTINTGGQKRLTHVTKTINTDVKYNNTSNINNTSINKKTFSFSSALKDLGVQNDVINTFMKIRKSKKAINSKIAFNKIEREIKKSRRTANDVITICVENSWKGFSSEWLKDTPQIAKKKPRFRTH